MADIPGTAQVTKNSPTAALLCWSCALALRLGSWTELWHSPSNYVEVKLITIDWTEDRKTEVSLRDHVQVGGSTQEKKWNGYIKRAMQPSKLFMKGYSQ